jgi:hypothetical protein
MAKFTNPNDLINYRALENYQEIARAFEMADEYLDTVNK